MATTMKVDCNSKPPTITFTWHVWAPASFSVADIQTIKDAVDKFWNKTEIRYFNCLIKVVVDIVSERDRKDKKPDEYDELTDAGKGGKGEPHGGGATMSTGSESAGSHHKIGLSRQDDGTLKPETIAHELGHAMGIPDPTATTKWDKDGIKPSDIFQILKGRSIEVSGQWHGWLEQASCCRPAGTDAGTVPPNPEPKKDAPATEPEKKNPKKE
jgi:hypothetical protein